MIPLPIVPAALITFLESVPKGTEREKPQDMQRGCKTEQKRERNTGKWRRHVPPWSGCGGGNTSHSPTCFASSQTHRRVNQICAPEYLGCTRSGVARTRTTVGHAYTYQWIGTSGSLGNGDSRAERTRALEAITQSAFAYAGLPPVSCATCVQTDTR